MEKLKKINKEAIDTTVKSKENLSIPEYEVKVIKDIILRNFRDVIGTEEEKNYCKPIRESIFWSNNYIEHESNSDRNKILLVEEYLNEIRPYLNEIINNLKKPDTCKTQLAIANNFISSIGNDQERVIHSKSDNIEIMINDKADEVIEDLFESLKNRYQNNLVAIKGSEFVFDYVHLLYYKCHKINPNRGELN